MKYIIIFVTCANKKEAEKITKVLIEEKLVACVQNLGTIKSTYWWKGKIEKSNEILLTMKTTKSKFTAVVKIVKELHSYEVPEIIALPIVEGSADYLNWIDECVK